MKRNFLSIGYPLLDLHKLVPRIIVTHPLLHFYERSSNFINWYFRPFIIDHDNTVMLLGILKRPGNSHPVIIVRDNINIHLKINKLFTFVNNKGPIKQLSSLVPQMLEDWYKALPLIGPFVINHREGAPFPIFFGDSSMNSQSFKPASFSKSKTNF